MKRTILLASLLAALVAVLPATSSATVHKCPANPQGTGYSPRNDRDAPNQVTIVRNISCHAAGWGAVEHGFLTPRGDLRTPGWHCVVLKRGTGTTVTTPGANVRCVRGRKAFRWTWGP